MSSLHKNIFLGLGTNLGDRKSNLESALQELVSQGVVLKNISPVYETPALLPEKADPSWNMPFLNIVVQIETAKNPNDLLALLQYVENKLGRTEHEKWSPRVIDIDILLWADQIFTTKNLIVPHPEIQNRTFVLCPLKDIAPNFEHPVFKKNLLALSRELPSLMPSLMGILNATPDSFSDGGQFANPLSVKSFFQDVDTYNIPIIDIGAESTRPGAELQSPNNEWKRLEPILTMYSEYFGNRHLKPKLSLDTRHSATVQKALPYGVSIINDVSGFEDKAMAELIQSHNLEYILMHNLGIPANPQKTLSQQIDATNEVLLWTEQKLNQMEKLKVPLNKVILDPGIGFGKMALHSFQLLQNIEAFLKFNQKILIGHSRKSFMNMFAKKDFSLRDPETLGISLYLINKKVDIIRVHDAVLHKRALLAYQHCL